MNLASEYKHPCGSLLELNISSIFTKIKNTLLCSEKL